MIEHFFLESYIIDVWQDFKYAIEKHQIIMLNALKLSFLVIL